MKVCLAGYNLDIEVIKGLSKNNKNPILTPETISAAYARISRSPKVVGVLRSEALKEVEKARNSNRRIIFEMSHHSIAEHAVFNFDITGISRRAVEEFEHFRLCSYTEKSQRYVTLKGDFLIPKEIRKTALVNEFCEIIHLQNNLYQKLFNALKSYKLKKHPNIKDPYELRLLENAAKEDARYILSLATQTQLGATVNARNLELIMRRFASQRLAEIQELGRKLYKEVKAIAPSLILFFKANDYDQKTYPELQEYSMRLKNGIMNKKNGDVILEDYTPDGDDKILAALLFRIKKGSYASCLKVVKRMSEKEKIELFKQACKYLELYDVVLREFEMVNYIFSLIVSAGCFGQLKRHRLMTLIAQEYDPDLGITIPPSIKEIKMEREFKKVINDTEKLFKKIIKVAPHAGSYILTNAHKKRVLVNVNLRELYHISRLREDPTAQWDIKNISRAMSSQAKKVTPITSALLCGKTDYPETYYKLYKKYPKVTSVPPPG
ncbi:MAG: FAD-dependent thymidylate synthase [bacterium]